MKPTILKLITIALLLYMPSPVFAKAKGKLGVVLPSGKDRSIDYGRIRTDGASYYNGPRIIQKVLEDYGISVSIDTLTVDSDTKFGISHLKDLAQALRKHGLSVSKSELSFTQAEELSQTCTLLTTISKNSIYVIILSVEDNGVRLFSPELYNKSYLMPLEIFQRSWDGTTLVISNNSD